MELAILFNGTPAEFGTVAEYFARREEAKNAGARFWVEQVARHDLGRISPMNNKSAADPASILVGFRRIPMVVNGKRKVSPSGRIMAIKLPVGSQLLVLAEDKDWPALENLWLLLQQHLQALKWLEPPGVAFEQWHPHDDRLTVREREIARYLAQGFTKPQIAERLAIQPGTIKAHCVSIKRKWAVQTEDTSILQVEARRRGYNPDRAPE